MNKEQKAQLSLLAAHMNKIEGRLKSAENVRQEVVIAGINELRYAGRRFVDAWALLESETPDADIEKEVNEHLIIARQYLINADHDITDSICFYVHGEINRLQKKYGAAELVKVDPNYASFIARMNEANAIVSDSRETRAQRAAAYEMLEKDYLKDLLDRHNTFRVAEPLILTDEKKKAFRNRASVWFGVIGGAIGILGTIVSIIAWDGSVNLPGIGRLLGNQAAEAKSPASGLPVMTMPPFNSPPKP